MFQPPAWEVVETRTRGIAGPGKITNEYDALVSMSWISWNILVYTYKYIYNKIYIYNIYIYTEIHIIIYDVLWTYMPVNDICDIWCVILLNIIWAMQTRWQNWCPTSCPYPCVFQSILCQRVYSYSLLMWCIVIGFTMFYLYCIWNPRNMCFFWLMFWWKKYTQVNWARGIFNNHPIKYQTSLSSLDLGMVNYK